MPTLPQLLFPYRSLQSLRRAPCAVQQALISCLLYIQGCVCVGSSLRRWKRHLSSQQCRKRWFDIGEEAEMTPGRQDKDQCGAWNPRLLPPSQESSPGAGTLIPCFLQGLGPKAQKVGGPAVMGGPRHGAHRPGAAGPTDTRERRESGEGQRGERWGETRKAGSRETLGKLSSVQSALAFCFSSVWSPARGMRPTPHER